MKLTIDIKRTVFATKEIELQLPLYRADWDADDCWSSKWSARYDILPDGSVREFRISQTKHYSSRQDVDIDIDVSICPSLERMIADIGIDERTSRIQNASTADEFAEAFAEAMAALQLARGTTP